MARAIVHFQFAPASAAAVATRRLQVWNKTALDANPAVAELLDDDAIAVTTVVHEIEVTAGIPLHCVLTDTFLDGSTSTPAVYDVPADPYDVVIARPAPRFLGHTWIEEESESSSSHSSNSSSSSSSVAFSSSSSSSSSSSVAFSSSSSSSSVAFSSSSSSSSVSPFSTSSESSRSESSNSPSSSSYSLSTSSTSSASSLSQTSHSESSASGI